MKKLLLVLSLVLLSVTGIAQELQNLSTLKGKKTKAAVRLQYISFDMPVDQVSYPLESKMGMMGLHYLVHLKDWLYTGVGMNAAITGDQGGLFTLGVDLGINHKIYKNLYLDANVHFGGGGGFRSLVNGGAIINPNIGLQYKTPHVSFGAQYSHANFFTGIMKTNSLSFFVEIPSFIKFADYSNARKDFIADNLSSDSFWQQPAVKNVQQVRFDFFYPIGGSREDVNSNNAILRRTLYVIGFEYQKYLNPNFFLYVHTDTVYKGLTAGFMDLYFGGGYNFINSRYINFFAKAGIGAAGGRIAQEGGITMYPSAGFDIKLTKTLAFSAHGGYLKALDGDFEAYTAGFGIKYFGLSGGSKKPFSKESIKKVRTSGFRIGVENQSFFNVKRFGAHTVDLQLIAFKPYYDLTKNLYLMGEASFAYEGNSGGYAHGVFGVGLKSNRFANQKISGVVEFSLGAAGGGRVDTGEGIVIRPTIGLNYHVNDALTFNISGGQLISPYGNVNSSNFNIGFSYGLAFLNAKK
jgi:hypothetical protein